MEKRALDSIPDADLSIPRRDTRGLAQNQSFEKARAFLSQSHSRAAPHDTDAPALASDGEAETYFPHQVKSRNQRRALGPRRSTGTEDCIVVEGSVHTGEDLEDVPEDELHPLDPRNEVLDPFYPFVDGKDFLKAHWFIKNRISDGAITTFFNHGVGTAESFQSPHTLHRLIEEMEPALDSHSWTKGKATFVADKKNADQPYYFRDLETSIRFLMEQPCFRDYMVYAPVKEYSGPPDDPTSYRLYSEPNTGDEWHEQQVIFLSPTYDTRRPANRTAG